MATPRGGPDYGNRGLSDLSFLQRSSLPRKVIERANVASVTGQQPNFVPSVQMGAPEQPSAQNLAVKERIPLFREGYTAQMWGRLYIFPICSTDDSINDEDEDDCCLYVVDLEEEDSVEWSLKAPTIRFSSNRIDFGAFCVLGNSLYIFEMYHRFEPETGKRVWKYKLPISAEVVNKKLDEGDVEEVSSMKYPKHDPTAIPTPDGKILVYSCTVGIGSRYNANKCDFELYDPNEQLWEQLPGLSCGNLEAAKCVIFSLSFIDNEPIVLMQTDFGMFTIDLRPSADDKQWNCFIAHDFHYLPRAGPNLILIRDHLCLTSLAAYELVGDDPRVFSYPELPPMGMEYDFLSRFLGIALVKNNNRGCYFCITDLRLMETMIPYLVIYMYRFDYNKFKEDLEKGKVEGDGKLLPGTKLIKKLKFVLSRLRSYCFYPGSLFYNSRENN